MFRLTLSRKLKLIIALPIIAQVVCFVGYGYVLNKVENLQLKEHHNEELAVHTNWVALALSSALASCSQLVVTEDKDYLAAYKTAMAVVEPEPKILLDFASDDRQQIDSIHRFIELERRIVDRLNPVVAAYSAGDHKQARELLAGKQLKQDLEQIVQARKQVIESEHRSYQAGWIDLPWVRDSIKETVLLCLALNIIASTILIAVVTSNLTRRLDILTDNSNRLASGQPLNPQVFGDDDISALDATFHKMAASLDEAARKERAIVDKARDLICSLDVGGNFLRVNHASTLILGAKPEELTNRSFFDYVDEEDRARVTAVVERVVGGKDEEPFECTLINSSHDKVAVLVSAHWSEPDRSLFCVVHDVTQRRQVERMKRQFLAMITHDLRSPLTSICNTLQLFAAGVYSAESEKGQARIDEATQNVTRMLRLISDLLEMEKLDATQLVLEIDKVNVTAIIEEATGSVRAYAEQQQLTVDVEAVDAEIEADGQRLVQVLINLLSNAIKFSPPSSSIAVAARLEEDRVVIQIRDHGPGIPEEERQILFEPYKQAKSQPAKPDAQGTGLGLTICKSIVQAHHGKIGVTANQPTGSIFWIELPCRQPSAVTRIG